MMPHLAVPSLTAFLRLHGIEVVQRDLNAEIFDQVLSSRHLRTVFNQIRRKSKQASRESANQPLAAEREHLNAWAMEVGKGLVSGIDQAKAIIKSERFFEPAVSTEAFFALTDALALASVPHAPSELRLTGYSSLYPPDASQSIRAAVQDREFNLFRSLFQVSLIPDIRRERPDLVGISLTGADQVVAGFTIASLIREAGLDTHIVLGGKMIACWKDRLPLAASLWDLFDSAIYSEGEVALLRLIEALDRHTDLSAVPNLMYRHGHQVRVNESKAPEQTGGLPTPDFAGLALGAYLSPELVLPISASRGCYWGRCAYCNVGYGDSKHFSERQGERVAAEMLLLAAKHDTVRFFFADEALSPRMLKSLSTHLIASGHPVDWACCARFEHGITRDLLHRMRRAGCRMVLYGLESGSQRVLDHMNKGTQLDTAKRILFDGAQAGIWNHIFFFFGFPGETERDAQETIDFFTEQRSSLHSVCTGTFLLEPDAAVAQRPADFDLSRVTAPQQPPGLEHDLLYYYDYEVSSGISSHRAEAIEAQFLANLPDKVAPQYYFHDIYRFLYACHIGGSGSLPTMLN